MLSLVSVSVNDFEYLLIKQLVYLSSLHDEPIQLICLPAGPYFTNHGEQKAQSLLVVKSTKRMQTNDIIRTSLQKKVVWKWKAASRIDIASEFSRDWIVRILQSTEENNPFACQLNKVSYSFTLSRHFSEELYLLVFLGGLLCLSARVRWFWQILRTSTQIVDDSAKKRRKRD